MTLSESGIWERVVFLGIQIFYGDLFLHLDMIKDTLSLVLSLNRNTGFKGEMSSNTATTWVQERRLRPIYGI